MSRKRVVGPLVGLFVVLGTVAWAQDPDRKVSCPGNPRGDRGDRVLTLLGALGRYEIHNEEEGAHAVLLDHEGRVLAALALPGRQVRQGFVSGAGLVLVLEDAGQPVEVLVTDPALAPAGRCPTPQHTVAGGAPCGSAQLFFRQALANGQQAMSVFDPRTMQHLPMALPQPAVHVETIRIGSRVAVGLWNSAGECGLYWLLPGGVLQPFGQVEASQLPFRLFPSGPDRVGVALDPQGKPGKRAVVFDAHGNRMEVPLTVPALDGSRRVALAPAPRSCAAAKPAGPAQAPAPPSSRRPAAIKHDIAALRRDLQRVSGDYRPRLLHHLGQLQRELAQATGVKGIAPGTKTLETGDVVLLDDGNLQTVQRVVQVTIGRHAFAIAKVNGRYLVTTRRRWVTLDNGESVDAWDFVSKPEELKGQDAWQVLEFLAVTDPHTLLTRIWTSAEGVAKAWIDRRLAQAAAQGVSTYSLELDNLRFGVLWSLFGAVTAFRPQPGDSFRAGQGYYAEALDPSKSLLERYLNWQAGGGMVILTALEVLPFVGGPARKPVQHLRKHADDLMRHAARLSKRGCKRLAQRLRQRAQRARKLAKEIKESSCFLAGTLVPTREGSRAIEDIRRGDEVLSRDQATGEQGYKRVVRLFRGHTDQVVDVKLARASTTQSGRSERRRVREESKCSEDSDDPPSADDDTQALRCTTEHPFWVRGKGWVEAGDLQVGDRLLGSQGEDLVVTSRQIKAEEADHYNFEVEGWHTYFVSERENDPAVWVHNRCFDPPRPARRGPSS